MGQALIDCLLAKKAATRAQVDEALRRQADGAGSLSSLLVEAGVTPRAVLQALCDTTGFPAAPVSVLKKAPKPPDLPLAPGDWWRLKAAPVGWSHGTLVVVLTDPEAVRESAFEALEKARVFLGLERDVRATLERMFGPEPEPMTVQTVRSPADTRSRAVDERRDPSGFDEEAPKTLAQSPEEFLPELEFEEATQALALGDIRQALAAVGALASDDTVLSDPARRQRSSSPKSAPLSPFSIDEAPPVLPADAADAASLTTDPEVSRPFAAFAASGSATPAFPVDLEEGPGLSTDPDVSPPDPASAPTSQEAAGFEDLPATEQGASFPSGEVAPAAPPAKNPALDEETLAEPAEPSLEGFGEPTQAVPPGAPLPTMPLGRPAISRSPPPPPAEAAPAPIAPGPRPSSPPSSGPRPPLLSGYEAIDALGHGGMSTVWRARRRSTGGIVAIKVLSQAFQRDPGFAERFRREIRASAALDHANLVRVLDYGEENGEAFLVTELMDAGSLRDVLHTAGTVPVLLAVKLVEHLLRGLEHAHARGILHRDLKPGNFMLSSAGVLKIGDFGIAKSSNDEASLTGTGAVFGTPAYMSPEQALGSDLDARSDLFSIGVVAYELLAGENPFHADVPSVSLLKISRGIAPPVLEAQPATPPLLQDILEKLLMREREQRYASAGEVLADLGALVEIADRRHPQLIARYLREPVATLQALREEHGRGEIARARALLARGPAEASAGALAVCAAERLLPDDPEVRALLEEIAASYDVRFGPSTDARIEDAERELEKSPDVPALARRLSDLYRGRGNLHRAAAYLRRYLALRPNDAQARAQLAHFLGDEPLGGLVPPGGREQRTEALARAAPPPVDVAPRAAPPAAAEEAESRPFSEPSLNLAAEYAEALQPPPPPKDLPPPEYLRPLLKNRAGGLQLYPAHAGGAFPLPERPPAQPPRRPEALGVRKRRAGSRWFVAAALLGVFVAAGLFSGRYVFGPSGAPVPADPGPGVPLDARQRALLVTAAAQAAAAQHTAAKKILDHLIGLGPETPVAHEARVLRAKVLRRLGREDEARRDLERVLKGLPETNLLHLEARQLLAPSR